METITIDGMDEHDFRHSIEDMLRQDDVDDAINRLRTLLSPYAGEGRILPPRFLTVSTDQIVLTGWSELGQRLGAHDRPDRPISAIGIAMADPIEAGRRPDAEGRLAPCIETCYLSDTGFPFSEASREDLLDGYSREGFEYQGDFEAIDNDLGIEGLDDLYGAIAQLETRLLRSDDPDPEEIRAGSLGACFLAALVHQAVRDTIRLHGLPRPLCVMTGCDGVYPFFDAPVTGSVEDSEAAAPAWHDEWDEDGEPERPLELTPGEASLLSLISRKEKTKKPVLVLNSEDTRKAERFNEVAAAHQMRSGRAATPDDHAVHEHDERHSAEPGFVADSQAEDANEAFDPVPEDDDAFASLDSILSRKEQPAAVPAMPNLSIPDFTAAPDNDDQAQDIPEISEAPAAVETSPTIAEVEPSEDQPVTGMPEPAVPFTEWQESEEVVWPVRVEETMQTVEVVSEVSAEADAQRTTPSSLDFTPDRHSLRSRIAVQQPQYSTEKQSRIAAFFGWLRQLF